MMRSKHIAMCSFGKDSLATILLALEYNEPLDEALFVEVMFDKDRGISGEVPEHIEWVKGYAIPLLANMGVKTKILHSDKDYMYFFTNAVGGVSIRAGSTAFQSPRDVSLTGIVKYVQSINILRTMEMLCNM